MRDILIILMTAAITCAIELPISLLFYRRPRPRFFYAVIILANIATNMVLNLLLLTEAYQLIGLTYFTFLIPAEICVFLLEGLCYTLAFPGCGWKKGFLCSLAANAASLLSSPLLAILILIVF